MDPVTELFRKAADLPEEDRAALAGLLIESLESERDPDVDEAWAAEIERRVEDIKSGRVEGVPWETVRARLLGRPREP